jgi:hypothetical protein
MGNLYEGDRAFDAVAGQAALAADINGLQDQLKVALDETTIEVLDNQSVSSIDTDFIYGSGDAYRTNGGTANYVAFFPIYLPAGYVIRNIYAEVSGDVGATGGSATFEYGAIGAAPSSVALNGATGNFWDTGGTAYANKLALNYNITDAQLPKTVSNGSRYFLKFVGPSSAHTARIWTVQYAFQIPR